MRVGYIPFTAPFDAHVAVYEVAAILKDNVRVETSTQLAETHEERYRRLNLVCCGHPDHHLWCRSTSKGHRGTIFYTARHILTWECLTEHTWEQTSHPFGFAFFKIVATVSLLWQCPSAWTLTSVVLTP